MEKLLELILQLQNEGLYLSEIEKSKYNCYIIYFGYENDFYYCSVSKYSILGMDGIPKEVKNRLQKIQLMLKNEKLEKENKKND